MLIYQATKRVSQYVLKDEKEFVEQLKAQYELQCEKDNTDDKKELLVSPPLWAAWLRAAGI